MDLQEAKEILNESGYLVEDKSTKFYSMFLIKDVTEKEIESYFKRFDENDNLFYDVRYRDILVQLNNIELSMREIKNIFATFDKNITYCRINSQRY